jgi:hypothetical protein
MSSCAEEQAMELEVIESLFPTELQKSPDVPNEFSLVGIVPYSDQSQTNFVSIDIKFIFPPLYPLEESLQYHVTKISGGNIASDSSKISLLDDTIRAEIDSAGLGYPIVYQVVEKIVEFLREHNREEMSLHDQMLEKKVTKTNVVDSDDDDSDWSGSSEYDSDYSDSFNSDDDEEEEEEEDYKGLQLKNLCLETERVTDDQFAEWKCEYDKWLIGNGWIKRVAESDLRPTGKQQFLTLLTAKRGAADKVDEEFDEALFGEDDIDEDDLVGDC